METPLKYSIGFDCSKDDLEAALLLTDIQHNTVVKATRKFTNTQKGFSDCGYWITHHCKLDIPVCVCIEATGNYHENVVFYLYQRAYKVSVVLPNKARKYMQSLGLKSKNDKIDAKGLAQMGAEQNLTLWQPFSETIYDLRALTRYCEQLACHRTQFMNQLSSMQSGMYQTEDVAKGLQELIDLTGKQIDETKTKIQEMIQSDEKMNERFNKILPIKGLGFLTLATVVAETNGFELFQNERQLASYAGYDVIENQSGKRVGKTRISKKGNSHIRRILHMSSLNVVRCKEQKFVDIYNRIMSKTTVKMKAYVAIQRKLLCLIYTLWKKNEAFDAQYQRTSGNAEQEVLFPHGFAETTKKVGEINPPTQDELPYKAFAGSPLSAMQIYDKNN